MDDIWKRFTRSKTFLQSRQIIQCKAIKPYHFFAAASLAEIGRYEGTFTILYYFACNIYRQPLKVLKMMQASLDENLVRGEHSDVGVARALALFEKS